MPLELVERPAFGLAAIPVLVLVPALGVAPTVVPTPAPDVPAPPPALTPAPCARAGLAASMALHSSAGIRVLLRIFFIALLSLEGAPASHAEKTEGLGPRSGGSPPDQGMARKVITPPAQ